jgi:hypothetical protein
MDIEDIRKEIAALELDAARYRWLRTQQWNSGCLCVVATPRVSVKLGSDCPSMERLDELIDDAMHVQLEK